MGGSGGGERAWPEFSTHMLWQSYPHQGSRSPEPWASWLVVFGFMWKEDSHEIA